MTFPNNAWEHAESAPEICRNGNESTFRQNIGNSFSRHQYKHKIHIYTSNHNKASHIHQTTSITYTSNHKLHIYIKRQVTHTHIQQTTSFVYTYTSNHKLFLHKRRKMEEMGDINGTKELGRRSTNINMKQNRFE